MKDMPVQHHRPAEFLYDFVTCAAALLASDDEARRRQLEDRLLALQSGLQGTPVFEVFDIRDTALRAMLDDIDDDPASVALIAVSH